MDISSKMQNVIEEQLKEIEEKENVFKEINSVDLSYCYNYSCKSCFVKGFIVNELNNKGMKIIK